MAARLTNNPKSRNVGYVENALRLDIRDLRRAGILKEGARQTYIHHKNSSHRIIADLRDCKRACISVETSQGTIRVDLVARQARFGGLRWFFLDEKDRPCEILYWSNRQFVSREAAKLSYRSQSEGDVDRFVSKRDAIERQLKGRATKGPSRGRRRLMLIRQRDIIDDVLNNLGGAIAGEIAVKRSNARKRAARSQSRLEQARAQIEQNRTVASEAVVGKHRHLLDGVRLKKPKKSTQENLPPQDDGDVRPRELSLNVLQRLGYLKTGEVTGYQIGWPEKWLGKGCRLYLLFDLRTRGNWMAAVVVEHGRRKHVTYFRIEKMRGRFGKLGYVFEDSATGARSGRLVWRRGAVKIVS